MTVPSFDTAPSILGLLQVRATLLHRTADPTDDDEYGNPGWDIVESDVVCELQQVGAREGHGDAVMIDTWRFWLPPDAPATGWDALRLEDGRLLELRGDPYLAHSARTGTPHHVEGFAVGIQR